jgi:DNA-binding CsgD family transcriptional regulator
MAAQVHSLTPPERQALSLAARGYSAKESAQALGKSPETIKAQLGIARLKLGAKNSTHAVVIALNDGLIAA